MYNIFLDPEDFFVSANSGDPYECPIPSGSSLFAKVPVSRFAVKKKNNTMYATDLAYKTAEKSLVF